MTNIAKRKIASHVVEGDWIIYPRSPRLNMRVVEVEGLSRIGLLKFSVDFGNGGQPATVFHPPNQPLLIGSNAYAMPVPA